MREGVAESIMEKPVAAAQGHVRSSGKVWALRQTLPEQAFGIDPGEACREKPNITGGVRLPPHGASV
jgi:hypothetical protein